MGSLLALVKTQAVAKNRVTWVTRVTPAPAFDSQRNPIPKNRVTPGYKPPSPVECVTHVTQAKNVGLQEKVNQDSKVTHVTRATLTNDIPQETPATDMPAHVAELDRFFAIAVDDGNGGWFDTAYLETLRQGGRHGR